MVKMEINMCIKKQLMENLKELIHKDQRVIMDLMVDLVEMDNILVILVLKYINK